jgi:hypothetical protein
MRETIEFISLLILLFIIATLTFWYNPFNIN